MSEDLHPIDDLFRSGLDGKEDNPTPQVWEAIERELDKKDRKPIGGFFRFSGKAAAVALIILGSAVLFAAGYFLRDLREERVERRGQRAEENPGPAQVKPVVPVDANVTPALPVTGAVMPENNRKHNISRERTELQPQLGKKSRSSTSLNASRDLNYTQPITAETAKHSSSADGINHSQVSKDFATALPPITEHEYLVPADKISMPASRGEQQRVKRFMQVTQEQGNAQAQIPVLNKQAAGLIIPKFSLTPYVSYQQHSVKLVDDGSHWGNDMRKDMERTEQLPSKISGGILADFRIGKNLSLQSGLGLLQLDVRIQPKQIRAEKDIDGKVKYRLDCSAGTYFINPKQGNNPRPGDTISTQLATNSLKYLNIPMAVKYHFGSDKLQFFATAGTGINILTSQNLNAMVKHQYQYYGGRTTNLKSAYFNGIIGAGATYFVGKRVGIYVSPQYNFALTSMNQGLPVKSLPRTFNVQTGITVKL